MIPELTGRGSLPPGIHGAVVRDVRRRFGSGRRKRVRLMRGLEAVLDLAWRAGARWLYLDGSFVTDKKDPGDWDAVLIFRNLAGVGSIAGALLSDRTGIKRRYGGDLFTVLEEDVEIWIHYVHDVFTKDRDGFPKGILRIDIAAEERSPWA